MRITIVTYAALAIAACGPTTINVTTTGEGEASEGGESSSGPIQDASTSLGATSAVTGSESGGSTSNEPMGTSTGRGDVSSGTMGGSSTTGGGEPSVCTVVMVGDDQRLDMCVCDGDPVEFEANPFGCFCGTAEVDPALCE